MSRAGSGWGMAGVDELKPVYLAREDFAACWSQLLCKMFDVKLNLEEFPPGVCELIGPKDPH